MNVTLIGTGLMGRAMGERLLAAGHHLTVYNRTREKAWPLAERGAALAKSAAEAVRASEAAILMLRDAAAIDALLRPAGRLPDLAGRTLIQMGTIAPEESLELAQAVAAAGGDYLEAPVLGSLPAAAAGRLLVMAGGPERLFERWRGLLEVFDPEPRHVGETGQAAALKLAFNQLIGSQLAAFALSLAMVRRRGLEPDQFLDILRRSALFAPTFDAKLPRFLERRFDEPNFPAELLLKDLELALGEVRGLGLEPAVLEGVRRVAEKTLEMGLGQADYSALYAAIDPPRGG